MRFSAEVGMEKVKLAFFCNAVNPQDWWNPS